MVDLGKMAGWRVMKEANGIEFYYSSWGRDFGGIEVRAE